MSAVILLEVNLVDKNGAASVLRLCDRPIRPFAPNDTERPNAQFDDRLLEPPSIRRSLFADLSTLSADAGFGDFSASNADGGLDYLQSSAFGKITVWRWTAGAFSTAQQILIGQAAAPVWQIDADGKQALLVPLTDLRGAFDRPLQDNLYAGTNANAADIEGKEGGIKGRPKPLAFGDLSKAHIPGVLVNDTGYIWQLHDGQINGSEAVSERGDLASGLIDDGDLSSSVFDSTTPVAAHYQMDLARGLFKHGGAPGPSLGFDFLGDAASSYSDKLAGIAKKILQKAGVSAGDISADFATAEAAATAKAGLWISDAVSVIAALDFVARGDLAAVLPDRAGVWRWVELKAAGGAGHTIDFDEIISLEADDDEMQIPVWDVEVLYARNYQVLTGDNVAPTIRATTREEFISKDWRLARKFVQTTKDRWPGARSLRIESALIDEADALALAARLLALFGPRSDGTPKQVLRVVREQSSAALTVDLGQSVRVKFPPASIDRDFTLIEEEVLRPDASKLTWRLFG